MTESTVFKPGIHVSSRHLGALAAAGALLASNPGLGSCPPSSTNWGRLEGFYPAGPVVSGAVKTGRNDPCPCGSGKKFKRCCKK
jgi:hypothetical protein